MANLVIKIGKVENIDDDGFNGNTIKVRLMEDGKIPISDIPSSFPLLPKMFSVMPKVGEAVLIFMSEINNGKSQRYYLGPIISQPQYFERDFYGNGEGSATSLINKSGSKPLQDINMIDGTHGSFPQKNDVSIIGRVSEDIILKKGEINLRCGIRQAPDNANSDTKGNIFFNNFDPAYIQLKYKKNISSNIGKEANSVINLVADKINLIGNNVNDSIYKNSSKKFNTNDPNELITDNDLNDILKNAEPAVLGHVLVGILEKMRTAIINHYHPYPGIPPIKSFDISNLENINMTDIESNNVRLN